MVPALFSDLSYLGLVIWMICFPMCHNKNHAHSLSQFLVPINTEDESVCRWTLLLWWCWATPLTGYPSKLSSEYLVIMRLKQGAGKVCNRAYLEAAPCPSCTEALSAKVNVTFKWRAVKGSELPIAWAASANQSVISSILCEKPEEQWPCLAHELVRSNRAKDWWIPNYTFATSHGTHHW